MNGRVNALCKMSREGTLLQEVDDILRRYRDRKLTEVEVRRLAEWLPMFFAARPKSR